MDIKTINLGDLNINLEMKGDYLCSLGVIEILGTPLRNHHREFLPWFDSYDGSIFNNFELKKITNLGDKLVINTLAYRSLDPLFRVQRDIKNRPVFRTYGWKTDNLCLPISIHFELAEQNIHNHHFKGFRYWYEVDNSEHQLDIFRLVDRQTWELGGTLDQLNVCLRNWSHAPVVRLRESEAFSIAPDIKDFNLGFIGNTLPRWAMLPAFDMQYGAAGILLGLFDQVSLIETLVETDEGEPCLRFMDLHAFAKSKLVKTNPKTILFSNCVISDIDAVNLWTSLYEQEKDKARKQFGIEFELPQQICLDHNTWVDFHFDKSYESTLDIAAEFNADYVFIDPVWEHGEALNMAIRQLGKSDEKLAGIFSKVQEQNMCCTLDFEIAESMGGVDGLKALCERAASRNLKIISWMSLHYSPVRAKHLNTELLNGSDDSYYAADESGYHPDTGYPPDCWPVDLQTPLYDKICQQLTDACKNTGLQGFLWDSFPNLGWNQVDFRRKTFSPQFEKAGKMLAHLQNQGLYIRPEGLPSFSGHSTVGMLNGNHYSHGITASYGYDSQIGFYSPGEDYYENKILRGQEPIDLMFEWMAHRHVSPLHFQLIPRSDWNHEQADAIKSLHNQFRQIRHLMIQRTVCQDLVGVVWKDGKGEEKIYYSLSDKDSDRPLYCFETGELVERNCIRKNTIYKLNPNE